MLTGTSTAKYNYFKFTKCKLVWIIFNNLMTVLISFAMNTDDNWLVMTRIEQRIHYPIRNVKTTASYRITKQKIKFVQMKSIRFSWLPHVFFPYFFLFLPPFPFAPTPLGSKTRQKLNPTLNFMKYFFQNRVFRIDATLRSIYFVTIYFKVLSSVVGMITNL